MIASLPPMPRRTLVLAAGNLAAVALVAWPWVTEGTSARRFADAPRPAVETPALAVLPPAAAFAATAERPLFSPSRRPPSAPATAGKGALDGRYRLLGLVIAGPARRALVIEIAGGRRLELSEGDAIEGWTVKRIDRDRVLFTSPAAEATLTLGSASAPAPAGR
jgi:general secretion pathway protein N